MKHLEKDSIDRHFYNQTVQPATTDDKTACWEEFKNAVFPTLRIRMHSRCNTKKILSITVKEML
jgi:hypothetical protein